LPGGASGIHDLFLKFTGGSGNLFTFNWWKFNPAITGTGASKGKRTESGNRIKMTTYAGKTSLRLDFPQPFLNGKLHVRLFDAKGRFTKVLFSGRLTRAHLTLPLEGVTIRPGAYVVNVSLDDATLIGNGLLFNNTL
jgi:hypothetical protein